MESKDNLEKLSINDIASRIALEEVIKYILLFTALNILR